MYKCPDHISRSSMTAKTINVWQHLWESRLVKTNASTLATRWFLSLVHMYIRGTAHSTNFLPTWVGKYQPSKLWYYSTIMMIPNRIQWCKMHQVTIFSCTAECYKYRFSWFNKIRFIFFVRTFATSKNDRLCCGICVELVE